MSQVLPGWVLALLAGTLLLPALVASVDAFARARRRRSTCCPGCAGVGAWIAPFLAGLALAELLALTGATPAAAAGARAARRAVRSTARRSACWAAWSPAMALAFLLARWLAARPDPSLHGPDEPGAAVALALAVSVASLAALAARTRTPACWPCPPPTCGCSRCSLRPAAGRRARLLLVPAALLAPLLVALYYLFALSIDPLAGAWYLLVLVTGHSVGVAVSLAGLR